MPAVNDVIQTAVSWSNPSGGVAMNIFTSILTSVAINAWADVADDFEAYLEDLYAPWMVRVSDQWVALGFKLAVRDAGAGQWNQVYERALTTIDGGDSNDTTATLASNTVVAYPGAVRYRGFKNFPPASDAYIDGGLLNITGLASLLTTGTIWVNPFAGTACNFNNGVYSLATEQFRGFVGTIAAGSVVGSRVTRKTGVGI